MRLSIIVAMDTNRVIGNGIDLPWHLPADLKHFKTLTMGKPIIMGRKTHESIGRPLPGRENIILTRDATYKAEGCTVLNEINDVFEHCKYVEEIMITGGAEIYSLTLTKASTLYLTEVHTTVTGDTYFPMFNRDEWLEISRQLHYADKNNPFDYSFVLLKRR